MIAANPVFALEQFIKLIFKIYELTFARTCSLQNTPIANMATIAPKRGFSVATPLLRAGSVCFQVFRASQNQLDYTSFRSKNESFSEW